MVSGTSFAMNRTIKPQMLENIKNVPDASWPKHSCVIKNKERKGLKLKVYNNHFECSKMCKKHKSYLDPQIKITAR